MRYESNLDEHASWAKRTVAGFGLNSPSRAAPTVGNRVASTIADGIHQRGLRGEGPDGAWDRNARSTIKRKGFDAPNWETGEMLSEPELLGQVIVTHSTADVVFGTSADVQARGHYAETGQSSLMIVRQFYWITDLDADAAFDGFIDDFMDYLARG